MGAAEFLFLKKNKCPICDKILDAGFSPMEPGSFPQPNDVTICAYCATVLQYNNDLSYREANLVEIKDNDIDEYNSIIELLIMIKANHNLSPDELKNHTKKE